MSRSRFRFTLGQLLRLIALSAFALALLRPPGGPMVLALTGLVIPGFLLDRIKGGAGIAGGMLSGGLAFGGYGLIDYSYHYIINDPRFFLGSFLLLVPLLLVEGLLWGAAVSIALHFIINKTSPVHRTGDACGPIVWLGFDGGRDPPSSASRGHDMGGNHA